MNFPSIDIQGNILSSEILNRIRTEQANFQQGRDFKPDFNNSKLKDEISLAWQEAKGQWLIFQSKLARLKDSDTGTTETRNFWAIPFLSNLGYNLSFSKSGEELNGKTYLIGYYDTDLDRFPVYIGSFLDSLDKPPRNKNLKSSPHAMLQEYLNYSGHLYGLVTNGRQIRLLRDATRISRLSYVEFNLEKMLEEDLYSDFVTLYRLLHSSRMPKKIDAGAESIIEIYHQESLEAGSTIRSKLGLAVKKSIEMLAREFINNPGNTALREAVKEGKVNQGEFYQHQLHIIYRLLFLFVTEERNLVFGENNSPEFKKYSQIYFNYYSLLRLRKLAKNYPPPEAGRHYDLWLGLLNTFALFENQAIGGKLGIMSLGGELFEYDALCGSSHDLHNCHLSNSVFLQVIKSLTYFENENKVLIPVNYGDLDVEEFGSVYEGLLELKLNISVIEGSDLYDCSFESSHMRSQSGSHYTPEELVQPLIKHSLEYLVEDRAQLYYQKKIEKDKAIQSLLELKVCDVACGSGHILLSAARRISLEVARIRTDEEQPNPSARRIAMRDVIRNCIYGVDKNPLAVELCKVALWLEAYIPGEPLTFLDHRIRCGDSIVGLARREELENGIANEAFKTLPGDDKTIAKTYRDRNGKERKSKQIDINFEEPISKEIKEVLEKFSWFKNLPERTPEEVEKKKQQFRKYESSVENMRLKQLADTQVAQFFIQKNDITKQYLITDAEYQALLSSASKGLGFIQDRRVAYATTVAADKRFFHWFLEFPEVLQEGGFDCILGNPPFLGGQRLTGTFGNDFLNWVKTEYTPAGSCDLVTFFFRRIFELLRPKGFQALLATNTIAQGNAREGGLDIILRKGGSINFAIRSMRWPGIAAVEVALVAIHKGEWNKEKFLGSKKVFYISSYLDDTKALGEPYPLKQNEGKSFQGSIVLGKGFILTPEEAAKLIEKNPKNEDVLFPYLNGEDLNSNPNQNPSRWVINFFDWELEKCSKNYPEIFSLLEIRVKNERLEKIKNTEHSSRKITAEKIHSSKYWWRYHRPKLEYYKLIKPLKRVIGIALTSKTVAFAFLPNNYVYSHATGILISSRSQDFIVVQSIIHNLWAWKYASSMKSDLRYTNSDCYETFPMPTNISEEIDNELANIGKEYHEYRRQLMLDMQLGLTKTYNLFHDPECNSNNIEKAKEIREFKSANLQIPIEEAIQRIKRLRVLHKEMDEAVLNAYGWTDINLAHNFYEVDYLPENDRTRYTISPEARKEILKRLLELNHKIHEEEVKAGLWEKKKSKGKNQKVEGGLFGEGTEYRT